MTENILTAIAAYKKQELETAKKSLTPEHLEKALHQKPRTKGFLTALKQARAQIAKNASGPALIAEIKKASPSKGLIRKDFDPVSLAKAYEIGGATCLSILTDGPSFHGSLEDLKNVSQMTSLPCLRKDFLIDPFQVDEARIFGADAILVIMALVSDDLAKSLMARAKALDLDVLVEVHDTEEMKRAARLEAKLIGINNRNLKDFSIDLETTKTLAPLAPKEAFLITESGIFCRKDALKLSQYGASAMLVGESLMRQADVTSATRELLGQVFTET